MPHEVNGVTIFEDTTSGAGGGMQLARKVAAVYAEKIWLKVTFAHVTIGVWDREYVGIEAHGPNDWISAVGMQRSWDKLFMTAAGHFSDPPAGEPRTRHDVPPPPYGEDCPHEERVNIQLCAPVGTSVFLKVTSSTVAVSGLGGKLHVEMNGGLVEVDEVSGQLHTQIINTGRVHVRSGEVERLWVATSGDTEFVFGGTARWAALTTAEHGRVQVHRVTEPFRASGGATGTVEVQHRGTEALVTS